MAFWEASRFGYRVRRRGYVIPFNTGLATMFSATCIRSGKRVLTNISALYNGTLNTNGRTSPALGCDQRGYAQHILVPGRAIILLVLWSLVPPLGRCSRLKYRTSRKKRATLLSCMRALCFESSVQRITTALFGYSRRHRAFVSWHVRFRLNIYFCLVSRLPCKRGRTRLYRVAITRKHGKE